jgi:tRNA threonylcarbamoyladenosine modification (KEOPS) complex Cgi121 subunit
VLFEKISKGEKEVIVGVAEVANSKGLSKDQLVTLMGDYSRDLMAVQFFRAEAISGVGHILSAAQNAVNAWEGEYRKTRTLSMELLVYSSAQRQIGHALDKMGVHDDMESVAIAIIGEDQSTVKNRFQELVTTVGDEIIPMFAPSSERFQTVMTHFGIELREIEVLTQSAKLEDKMSALTRCVASRVSLVALES